MIEKQAKKTEIKSLVEGIVYSLFLLVCQSPSPGGDEPDDRSAAIQDGSRGDGENVVDTTSSAKGAEIRKSFGKFVGWLDPPLTDDEDD